MGKSSKDKRDAYYRLAKESGYRARSAYKLLQLDEAFNLLSFAHTSDPDDDEAPPNAPPENDGQQAAGRWPRRVIDLCAAPGSWSQVLARRLPPGSTIVAVDLQPMTPIPGVVTLQADITHPSTLALLQSHLGGKAGEGEHADLVVCDGAPDVTGLHDLDEYVQASLLLSALNLAACVLRPGANGAFVAKIFRGRDADLLFAQLRTLFRRVTCAKPRASRASSIEAFVVCQDYCPPPGFKPSLERPLSLDSRSWGSSWGEEGGGDLVSFVACGDLSALDADATFRLPAVGPDGRRRQSVEPVQPPTKPPYRRAVEMRRQLGGGGEQQNRGAKR